MMQTSELFANKVTELKLKLPDDPTTMQKPAGPVQENDMQVSQSSGVRVKVFRRGHILGKRERTFDGASFSAKQLNLKQHARLQEGKFKTSGHLVSLPNSTLECEVSCLLDVRTSTSIMKNCDLQDSLSDAALTNAFQNAQFGAHNSEKPFVEFLCGKSPSLSDLANRADRADKMKQQTASHHEDHA